MKAAPARAVVFAAVALRLLASYLLMEPLSRSVAFVTPLTSPQRADECLALLRSNRSPYESPLCHETPLALLLLDGVRRVGGAHARCALFILVDLLVAWALASASPLVYQRLVQRQRRLMSTGKLDAQAAADEPGVLAGARDKESGRSAGLELVRERGLTLVLGQTARWSTTCRFDCLPLSPLLASAQAHADRAPFAQAARVSTMYLLSPVSILVCASQSSTLLAMAAIVCALYAALRGNAPFAAGLCAIAGYQSIYNIVFFVRASLLFLLPPPFV